MQRALLQYFRPSNKELVLKALRLARRTDLIGTGPGCLVRDDLRLTDKAKSTVKKGRALTKSAEQKAARKLRSPHTVKNKTVKKTKPGRRAAAGRKGKGYGKKKK